MRVLAPGLLFLVTCVAPRPPALVAQVVRPNVPLKRLGTPAPPPASNPRLEVITAARSYLSGLPYRAHNLTFEEDPIGFVRAAYWTVGIDLYDEEIAADPKAKGMDILFRSVALGGRLHKETPRPADLIFWDRSQSGTAVTPSQVGLVEAVLDDGTIVALGSFATGPRRIRMNLRSPDTAGDTLEGLPAAKLFRSFADPM